MKPNTKVGKGTSKARGAAGKLKKAGDIVGSPPTGNPTQSQINFEEIDRLLALRPADSNVLLNIPIWGWTGDGKTCSLLTAIHFCDPAQHPLGFAFVTNDEELVALEGSNDDYKFLNIASTAQATTERLRTLSEQFIDKNIWPPGTDEPSTYILAIRNISSTLGYVMFPDMKGGSFRELDSTAREVLRKAHAAILLVNPELYHRPSTEGKRYRDDILHRLQMFGSAKVPVCVMITKADMHQGANHATDTTHSALTVVLERQTDLKAHLCRVSVVGLDHDLEDNKLPPVAERQPDDLIHAWIWVVAQALCRPAAEIRDLLPPVNIHAAGLRSNTLAMASQPELRQVGDFSNAPGNVLCGSGDESDDHVFTFISSDGELFEIKVSPSPNEEPRFQSVGKIPDLVESEGTGLEGYYLAGEFLIGPRMNTPCNHLWQGGKGGPLSKVPMPYEMVAWAPSTSRRVFGVDSSGRLHHLGQENGRWVQLDFIEGFIHPGTQMACAYSESTSHALVFNGVSVEGVSVESNGRFGVRVAPELGCTFDTSNVHTNRLGLCLSVSSGGKLTLSGPVKGIDLGTTLPESTFSQSLALLAPLVAFVAPGNKIYAAQLIGDEVLKTHANYSPLLHDAPESIAWTRRGGLLAVTFKDRTWQVFRPLGLMV